MENREEKVPIEMGINGSILESHMEGDIRVIDKLELHSVDILFKGDDDVQGVRKAVLLGHGALGLDTLDQYQKKLTEWEHREIPQRRAIDIPEEYSQDEIVNMALGVGEEGGEAARAVLKWRQSIRGYTFEKMRAKAIDGACDTIVYALRLLAALKVDASVFYSVADKVMQRTWKDDPKKGGRKDS